MSGTTAFHMLDGPGSSGKKQRGHSHASNLMTLRRLTEDLNMRLLNKAGTSANGPGQYNEFML